MQEDKWFSVLKRYWKKGAYALLILALAGIWGENFYKRRHQRSSHDYLVMHQIEEQFRRGMPLPLESIDIATQMIKRHPELHPSYDGMMAQCYFAAHDLTQAAIYTLAAQDRLSSLVHPNYVAFAVGTSKIAHKDYEGAYQVALQLEQELKAKSDFPMLRSFNLLRLLFLANSEERERWAMLLQEQAVYPEMASLFQQGQFSFNQFLRVQ